MGSVDAVARIRLWLRRHGAAPVKRRRRALTAGIAGSPLGRRTAGLLLALVALAGLVARGLDAIAL